MFAEVEALEPEGGVNPQTEKSRSHLKLIVQGEPTLEEVSDRVSSFSQLLKSRLLDPAQVVFLQTWQRVENYQQYIRSEQYQREVARPRRQKIEAGINAVKIKIESVTQTWIESRSTSVVTIIPVMAVNEGSVLVSINELPTPKQTEEKLMNEAKRLELLKFRGQIGSLVSHHKNRLAQFVNEDGSIDYQRLLADPQFTQKQDLIQRMQTQDFHFSSKSKVVAEVKKQKAEEQLNHIIDSFNGDLLLWQSVRIHSPEAKRVPVETINFEPFSKILPPIAEPTLRRDPAVALEAVSALAGQSDFDISQLTVENRGTTGPAVETTRVEEVRGPDVATTHTESSVRYPRGPFFPRGPQLDRRRAFYLGIIAVCLLALPVVKVLSDRNPWMQETWYPFGRPDSEPITTPSTQPPPPATVYVGPTAVLIEPILSIADSTADLYQTGTRAPTSFDISQINIPPTTEVPARDRETFLLKNEDPLYKAATGNGKISDVEGEDVGELMAAAGIPYEQAQIDTVNQIVAADPEIRAAVDRSMAKFVSANPAQYFAFVNGRMVERHEIAGKGIAYHAPDGGWAKSFGNGAIKRLRSYFFGKSQ